MLNFHVNNIERLIFKLQVTKGVLAHYVHTSSGKGRKKVEVGRNSNAKKISLLPLPNGTNTFLNVQLRTLPV
jgi:hypothetical protein